MPVVVPVPRWLQFVGLGKETTWNTPVTLTSFFPVPTGLKHRPRYEKIIDDGFRGNASQDQALYQGVGWSELDWSGMAFYPDDSGIFLMALFGADSVTGSNPYTHTLTLLNTAFPPSYTGGRYTALNGSNIEQVGGVYFSELTLKFVASGAQGKLTIDPKGVGAIQGSVAKPSNVYSTQQLLLGWQGALTLNSVASAKLLDGTVKIVRKVDQIFALQNSQNPSAANVDVMEITGNLTLQAADMTELNFYLNNTQPPAVISFTSGTNSLSVQMTKCAFEDPTELDAGSPYQRTMVSFRGIANSTDGGTGNAPGRVVLVNPRSTAY